MASTGTVSVPVTSISSNGSSHGSVGSPAPVVEVAGLRKLYGNRVAVAEVSFSVNEGEIFGILGPNGAGKTTTVECVSGLRRADGGRTRGLGLHPGGDPAAVVADLGVQLQHSALPANLRVGEALRLFSSFYEPPADWRELL